MDKAEEAEQKAEIALQISDAYLNQEQLQDARRFAQTAIDFDGDWGDPYIQIADIYAQAVSQCSSDRKMTVQDRAVYWVVLDYLNKAEQIDSSVSSEVSRKTNSYEPVTPTTEQMFFNNWKEGEEISIDASLNECYSWINETTTIR
jgi:hypothetical protein